MAEEVWKRRLKDRMMGLGLTMKSLSLAAGLGETGVRDMLKRTQSPSVDAVARVARALGWTLSDLYEGESASRIATSAISSVELIGQVMRAEASWYSLAGMHTIFLDERGVSRDIHRNEELVAAYDGDGIAVFEKVTPANLTSLSDSPKFLILTKGARKYFAPITVSGPDYITLALPDSDLELDLSDVEWIAKWKQTIPRSPT